MSVPWWRRAVVYQVYVRSFADSNGDGTGDIEGIISRIPYLQTLGVDAIWVNPWYASPLNDGGYDVSDYRMIHPLFGTIDDAQRLFGEARRCGIRVLVDLVPNHTSSDHEWFRAALDAPPGGSERSRYHFAPGRGIDGEEPPNNWKSVFGGSAWTRVEDGEWYLHLFDPTQPDVNWENPEVVAEFDSIMRYWLDLGASGFRVDVAHALVKKSGYPDAEGDVDDILETPDGDHPAWDQPQIHELVRSWRSLVDQYPGSVMVAEAWVPSWDRLARYIRPDQYHQTFDFNFLQAGWSREGLHNAVELAMAAAKSVGSVPTWVLSNHDVVRAATRFGLPQEVDPRLWLNDGDRGLLDRELGTRRARAAALLMLALPGSCYLYQGEELGLHEVLDIPEDLLDDPVWRRSGGTRRGRDGCRVPIPWDPSGPSLGFGDSEGWLPQPEMWADESVTVQSADPGSVLSLYRRALAMRDQWLTNDETLEWLDLGSEMLAFRRGSGVRCVVNMGSDAQPLPEGEILLTSGELTEDALPANTAVWVR